MKNFGRLMKRFKLYKMRQNVFLRENEISPNLGITRVFIWYLENLMVSIEKSKMPFENVDFWPR